MTKQRFEVVASSLGAYFGVGFNEPLTQLEMDMGLRENEFTPEAQSRMQLGISLEDAVLNFFEIELQISITERNEEIIYAFNDKLRCKIDGMTVFNGEETVVECKVSNSQGKRFTEDKGYYLQCQAYMVAKNVNQVLLIGLYQGKPIWKLIRRDDAVIHLIEQMVDYVYNVLNGMQSIEEFPWELAQQYAPQVILEEAEFDETDAALTKQLQELKVDIRLKEAAAKQIEEYFKEKFKNIKAQVGDLSISISTVTKSGGFDLDAYKTEHPDFDERAYMKPDYSYSTLRILEKKQKVKREG